MQFRCVCKRTMALRSSVKRHYMKCKTVRKLAVAYATVDDVNGDNPGRLSSSSSSAPSAAGKRKHSVTPPPQTVVLHSCSNSSQHIQPKSPPHSRPNSPLPTERIASVPPEPTKTPFLQPLQAELQSAMALMVALITHTENVQLKQTDKELKKRLGRLEESIQNKKEFRRRAPAVKILHHA
ncbi:hypothetical protein EDD21DRAFT_371151 [Dissophora ornata]|nr:hypothetical protein EDD21DRAFT_371151 [Dissophora ornata]